jgi:hypothetical protein
MLAQLDPDNPPEGLGRLMLLFVLALVIVAPFAIRTVRRVQSGEWGSKRSFTSKDDEGNGSDGSEGAHATEPTDRGTLEELIAAIRALEGDRHGRAEVLMQRHLTSQGRELPASMADTLVLDALRRSGWQVSDRRTDPIGTVLECVPRPDADSDD